MKLNNYNVSVHRKRLQSQTQLNRKDRPGRTERRKGKERPHRKGKKDLIFCHKQGTILRKEGKNFWHPLNIWVAT